MVRGRGIIPAVERLISTRKDTYGLTTLRDMGLIDYTFEAVVVRHPTEFTTSTVEIAKERL